MGNSSFSCLIILLMISCASPSTTQNKESDKENTIEKKVQKTSIKKETIIEEEKAEKEAASDSILLPESYDYSSETQIYYEDFIGKAYSKDIFKTNFVRNRKKLDSLIDQYDTPSN